MKLKPLPEMDFHSIIVAGYGYTTEQVRAIQLEAARDALEAAKQVCREFQSKDMMSNYGKCLERLIGEIQLEQP